MTARLPIYSQGLLIIGMMHALVCPTYAQEEQTEKSQIDMIELRPQTVQTGMPAKVIVTGSSEKIRCGLTIDFGDGESQDIKIDSKEDSFPLNLAKTYAKAGTYHLSVAGKFLFRGLKSYLPCKGKSVAALYVAPAGGRSRAPERLSSTEVTAAATETPGTGKNSMKELQEELTTQKQQDLIEPITAAHSDALEPNLQIESSTIVSGIRGLAISPNGRLLAEYSEGFITLRDGNTGRALRRWRMFEEVDQFGESGTWLCFPKDENTLAVFIKGGVSLWNTANGSIVGFHPASIGADCIDGMGVFDRLANVPKPGATSYVQIAIGASEETTPKNSFSFQIQSGGLHKLFPIPSGKLIGIAHYIDTGKNQKTLVDSFSLVDALTGKMVWRIKNIPSEINMLHKGRIAVSPDGRLLAYIKTPQGNEGGYAKGSIEIRNSVTGKIIRLPQLMKQKANRLAFVNDGAWLMAAEENPDEISFFDLHSGKKTKTIDGSFIGIFPGRAMALIAGKFGDDTVSMIELPSFVERYKMGRLVDTPEQISANQGNLFISSGTQLKELPILFQSNKVNLSTKDSLFAYDDMTGRIAYIADSIDRSGVQIPLMRIRQRNGKEIDIKLPNDDCIEGATFVPGKELIVSAISVQDFIVSAGLLKQAFADTDSDNPFEKGVTFYESLKYRLYTIKDDGKADLVLERDGLSSMKVSPDGKHLWLATGSSLASFSLPSFEKSSQLKTSSHIHNLYIRQDGQFLLAHSLDKLSALVNGKEYIYKTSESLIRAALIGEHDTVIVAEGQELVVWSPTNTKKLVEIPFPENVAWVSEDLSHYILDTNLGTEIFNVVSGQSKPLDCTDPMGISPNGRYLLCEKNGTSGMRKEFNVVDSNSGRILHTLTDVAPNISSDNVVFSSDSRLILFKKLGKKPDWDPECSFFVLDIETGAREELFKPEDPLMPLKSATSADGALIAIASSGLSFELPALKKSFLKLFKKTEGKYIQILEKEWKADKYKPLTSIDISPSGNLVALGEEGLLSVIDATNGQEIWIILTESTNLLRFSQDGKQIAGTNLGGAGLSIFDSASGKLLRKLPLLYGPQEDKYFLTRFGILKPKDNVAVLYPISGDATDNSSEIIFTSNNIIQGIMQLSSNLLALKGEGAISLFDIKSRKVLARILVMSNGSSVVVGPDGRFDADSVDDLTPLHWVMPDDPLRALPLEIFMRDYYEPRLLPRILAGEQLPPIPSLAALNRAQPKVEIKQVRVVNEKEGLVDITVEVSDQTYEIKRDGKPFVMQSGVYDLRLFRNGQLVAQLPEPQAESAPGEQTREQELALWRSHHQVQLDSKTGKQSITFRGIRLPRKVGLKQVEFSAYAFNVDRVKSDTARTQFDLPPGLVTRQARAYVVTIGVNGFEGSALKPLSYAANDAKILSAELSSRLKAVKDPKTGQTLFGETNVVPITLVTEFESENQTNKLAVNQATKDRIKAVLDKLAGHEVEAARLAGIRNAEHLQPARPEDLVLIAFSTHGDTDRRGQFYLMPYDLGASAEVSDIRQHAISSEELSSWLRTMDAGETVMIVDACHSAASVESKEFKPGPMGSRGLGQLAFDKGMRILAASQRDQYALETEKTQHGLLTYALVREGLQQVPTPAADFKPQDGRIQLSEWLNYGVERVPSLYRDYLDGKLKAARTAIPLDEPEGKIQQPALFDFARGRDVALGDTGRSN